MPPTSCHRPIAPPLIHAPPPTAAPHMPPTPGVGASTPAGRGPHPPHPLCMPGTTAVTHHCRGLTHRAATMPGPGQTTGSTRRATGRWSEAAMRLALEGVFLSSRRPARCRSAMRMPVCTHHLLPFSLSCMMFLALAEPGRLMPVSSLQEG